MTEGKPTTNLELHSLVTRDATAGRVEVRLVDVPMPEPEADQVVVRIEAAPINPSDLGLLLANADLSTARASGSADSPVLIADLTEAAMRALAARVDTPMPVGNEGAGTVVAAGSSPAAQALLGRTVAVAGGAMYVQYRCVHVAQCLVLPEGTPASVGGSAFVNPLTALGMVETMRREGHTALVHTAAASNLGQMLVKICLEDGVPLVNIVRKPEQAELLRSIGAEYVCDSSAPSFTSDLIEALTQTSATLGFDAIGGGRLAGQILSGMEAVAGAAAAYSRYGSTTHKQVYIYGGLDRSPTILNRNFGMAWGLGGWLLTPFLQTIGPDVFQAMRERVVGGLHTTFATTYTREISLAQTLQPEIAMAYAKHATGEKYAINPSL